MTALASAFAAGWRQACHDMPAAHDAAIAIFLDLAQWQPWLDEAWSLLDPVEQARVLRKHREADRRHLLLAYAAHRLVVASVLQCPAQDVALRRDANGRPFVAGSRLATSLSHAGTGAAVLVGRSGPLGIDLEPCSRAQGLDALAQRICHPREWQGLASLASPALGEALLALWVRKEAVLKAAGVGLACDMDSFEAEEGRIVGLPGVAAGCTVPRMLDAGPGWIAASSAPVAVEVIARRLQPCGGLSGAFA